MVFLVNGFNAHADNNGTSLMVWIDLITIQNIFLSTFYIITVLLLSKSNEAQRSAFVFLFKAYRPLSAKQVI